LVFFIALCFPLLFRSFFAHVVSSLAYPNLLGNKRLGCGCDSKHSSDIYKHVNIVKSADFQVASSYGWPVSTTHCIIGAMVGFGLVFGGVNAVFWRSLARVSSSWVISPVMGAAVSFIVYKCIRRVSA
jgi:hypothetical protein